MSAESVKSRAPPAASCPYKGLRPYGEEDADLFFGRKTEREIIA